MCLVVIVAKVILGGFFMGRLISGLGDGFLYMLGLVFCWCLVGVFGV